MALVCICIALPATVDSLHLISGKCYDKEEQCDHVLYSLCQQIKWINGKHLKLVTLHTLAHFRYEDPYFWYELQYKVYCYPDDNASFNTDTLRHDYQRK